MRHSLPYPVSSFRSFRVHPRDVGQTGPTTLSDHRRRSLRRIALLDLHHFRSRYHHAGERSINVFYFAVLNRTLPKARGV